MPRFRPSLHPLFTPVRESEREQEDGTDDI
jgi:hypothetical protein